MRLPKFLRRESKKKNWWQRVDYWPDGYPHRIAFYADVAAMQHIMTTGGILNAVAVDHLLRNEQFWWDLTHFFQSKVDELGEIEFEVAIEKPGSAVRKVPLYCWKAPLYCWEDDDG